MASLLDNIARPSAVVLQLSVVLGVIFVLLKVVQFYRERRKLVKALEAFPGPPKHWLYGHNHMIYTEKRLHQIVSWGEEYPYAFPRWFGPVLPSLEIHHPEYAKSILGRTDPKAKVPYELVVPWIGKGLLTSDGAKWFQHRKMLTPAFHYDVLKPYVTLMSDSVKVMLDKWDKKSIERKSVELFQDISLMTLDSLMKCAFSFDSNCQTQSETHYYIKAIYDLTYLLTDRVQNFSFKDVFYNFTRKGREFQKACKLSHTHTDQVIKDRKLLLSNEKELDKIQKKRHLDFLDILLCSKDANGVGLSDEDLRAEVDTFMFEGHDTTASGISWLFYCMSLHPHYQQRCREEIQGILGDRDTVEWEDLGKMTYTTMCIKESLRLFPPVPAVSRQLSKPITFPDGRSLPAGCKIGLNIFGIHRNRDVWEDPEIYDPSRFSPENTAQRHSHAFLPFSAGSRNCIGQQFAMNEIKVALALTLLRFELCPDPSRLPIMIPQVTLRSSNGIHLHLKKIR
ncbi:PREDICTED: cytochrome P450 4B1-like [Acanthisitta chloris]|uniref:cytochrome P450 4B1-like n=1 Tax=Acanthisitta chloris TaxID=57068 RepID=UPI0004F0F956|nr:PREDICTED: cytochrome P450 4B1-like [Acanthisitta chloris]